ncbi:hypothetical protein B0A49_09967 [Cryomyces minteri]|uniref:Transcription factor domain-containing protein n=1 Tax=Cryomyces minteri TaxID=331657 RepID=A0A4U0WP90_9PEZI|nr:hypothetical protein B0A49_09967 [Cryomyces minteri]
MAVPLPKRDQVLMSLMKKLDDLLDIQTNMRDEFQVFKRQLQPDEKHQRGMNGGKRLRSEGSNSMLSQSFTNSESFDDSVPTPTNAAKPPITSFSRRDEELALPIQYTTSVQNLFRWKSIAELCRGAIPRENYVLEGEERRGLLRLYGRGEGHDAEDNAMGKVAHPGAAWGTAFTAQPTIDIHGPIHHYVGDLTPDGHLNLEPSTVYRLFDSYLNNIHILHPFLDKEGMIRMIDAFVSRWGNTDASFRHPFDTSVANGTNQMPKGLKRRRSNERVDSPFDETTDLPDRSIVTALVLLVLALGRICEHKEPLPGVVKTESSAFSPTSSWSGQTDVSPTSRISEADPANDRPRSPRNVDVVPGLAYFAYATDILGNLVGGNDLPYVQANLLAGLYAGQLTHVLDSWKAKYDSSVSNERRDLIHFAFWTGLQLESDILAELNLPPSGISRHESDMPLPLGLSMKMTQNGSDLSPEMIMMLYYSAQVQLRKILNRAHTALYDSEKNGSKQDSWSNLTIWDLQTQLQEWRDTLPGPLDWNDSDPPSKDINAARLRAKYYGARYVINRPLLRHALDNPNFRAPGPTRTGSPANTTDRMASPMHLAPSHSQSGTHSPARNQGDTFGMMRKSTDGFPKKVAQACETCVSAAIASTIAFDGFLPDRFLVTNIFGTANA